MYQYTMRKFRRHNEKEDYLTNKTNTILYYNRRKVILTMYNFKEFNYRVPTRQPNYRRGNN